MNRRLILALLLAAAPIGPAAFAQQTPDPGGIRSETQRRLADKDFGKVPWDLLGLFGLFGLLGLSRGHTEDSYHPAPLE